MKISKFITVLCFIICVSCNNKSDNEYLNIITVDIHQQGRITDFIKSMDGYIFLETNDNSILQDIDKLKIEDGVIYIADRDVLQMFDSKDGKWLGKIDRQGRGHGEYLGLTDFDVYDSQIYILSRVDNKVVVYDTSGNAEETIRTADGFSRIQIGGDGKIWLYSSNSNDAGYNFVMIDHSGEIQAEQDPFPVNSGFIIGEDNPFCGLGTGCIYTASFFDNTVYALSEKTYRPEYRFNVNLEHLVTQQELNDRDISEIYNEYRFKEVWRQLRHIAVSDNKLVAEMSCFLSGRGNRTYMIAADLNTGESKAYLMREKTDPAFPLFDSGDIEGYDGKTVISSIYASWAKQQGEKYGYEDLAAISEYDNPVLVFHTLNY